MLVKLSARSQTTKPDWIQIGNGFLMGKNFV